MGQSLKGLQIKLGSWSLSCNEDLRLLKMPGPKGAAGMELEPANTETDKEGLPRVSGGQMILPQVPDAQTWKWELMLTLMVLLEQGPVPSG